MMTQHRPCNPQISFLPHAAAALLSAVLPQILTPLGSQLSLSLFLSSYPLSFLLHGGSSLLVSRFLTLKTSLNLAVNYLSPLFLPPTFLRNSSLVLSSFSLLGFLRFSAATFIPPSAVSLSPFFFLPFCCFFFLLDYRPLKLFFSLVFLSFLPDLQPSLSP